MLNKTIIASCILASCSVAATEFLNYKDKPFAYESKVNHVILKDAENATDNYFVQLRSMPAAFLSGSAKTMSGKLNTTSAVVKNKVQQLAAEQTTFLTSAKSLIGKTPKVRFKYTKAFNGLSVELSETEAEELLKLPNVLKVIRQIPYEMHTDTGPKHIGADGVWDNVSGFGMKGEGVVLGIIDSGINADHPSFAPTGDDGYSHVNPNGEGVYFGDCVINSELCNDKLIGIYSYDSITAGFGDTRPALGIDYNGHGSHVASTAGGNILRDLPYYKTGTGAISSGEPIVGSNITEMSGVAPHASIISFQVCGSTGGCASDAMLKAVEDGIDAGVDVFNMSIGPGGEGPHPWEDALDMAFLAANEAGIFVALSAGNSGSGASTVGHMAPWTTVVANATHGRYFGKTVTSGDNASTSFPEISGVGGIGESVSAEVVYAGQKNGHFGWIRQCNVNSSDADNLPDLTGKIVLCDRGVISLYQKAENVKALGAVGIIIRNYPGMNTALHSVPYSMPGLQINEADGNDLLAWIETQATAEVTISAGAAETDPMQANVLNASSSRGPNSKYPELLVPHIAAPGTDIYAAYTDEQPFHTNPAPSDYSFLSGTSMASPHIAGAAALIKQVNPDWSPAEIQSAMMLTANTTMYKEDGVTPSDLWDRGAGMIQVDQAAKSPLVMDVSYGEYLAADPARGNDASELNTAYVVNANCAGTCTFTRSFKATQDGNWNFAKIWDRNYSVSLSFEPASIEAKAGETYSVEITAEFARFSADDWQETAIEISPANNAVQSSLYIPVRLKPLVAVVPSQIKQDYYWNEAGFDLDGFMFRRPDNISFTNGPLVKGTSYQLQAAQDTDLMTPFDDLDDGTDYFIYQSSGDGIPVDFIVAEASNTDTDLFIGIDSNKDGIPQEAERICVSATVQNVGESCSIDGNAADTYWVLIWNWTGSEDQKDNITVDVVKSASNNLLAFNAIKSDAFFDYLTLPVSLLWDGELESNVNYYGSINVYEEDYLTGYLSSWGTSQVIIAQKGEAVDLTVSREEVSTGITSELELSFAPNTLNEDINFSTEIMLQPGFAVSEAVDGVQVNGNAITAEIMVKANSTETTVVRIPVVMEVATSGELTHTYQVTSSKNSKQWQGELTQVNPNVAPTLSIVSAAVAVKEGESFSLSTTASDANDDQLTYQWQQVSGVAAVLGEQSSASLTITMPEVEENVTLEFAVTISDGEFTVTETVSVIAENKRGSGGAAYLLLMLMLPLLARRKV